MDARLYGNVCCLVSCGLQASSLRYAHSHFNEIFRPKLDPYARPAFGVKFESALHCRPYPGHSGDALLQYAVGPDRSEDLRRDALVNLGHVPNLRRVTHHRL